MLVLNCERRTGTFTNQNGAQINYDNLYFTVDTGDHDGMIFGTKYKEIKVSVRDFGKYYPNPIESTKGKNLIFAFDQDKHLIGIYDVK